VTQTSTTDPSPKHPGVMVRQEQPLNAETPLKLLRHDYVTPRELFYVRNHGSLPAVDPANYRLTVSGLVERPLEISLEQLKSEFSRVEMVATLYCAGNRRRELAEVRAMPEKIPWDAGAAGNAHWAGVPLREVLHSAGVREEARHVAFTGLDKDEESGTGTNYGGSIPVEKGTSEDVLLAYEMNGEPLAPEHGFPLRVVVGGYIGARNVKWLSGISLQQTPSDNYYQTREYKLFPPHVTAETADHSRGEMLGEIPLNSVVCDPAEGEILAAGSVPVRGYAIAGGTRRVERVEVSSDGGETWKEASLEKHGNHSTAWCFWEASLDLAPGAYRILAKATDSAGDTQPEAVEEVWNFLGYANTAWHRVNVRAEG
jgi:sulfite oxidase